MNARPVLVALTTLMDRTDLLYALSTLAQTGAALAAFIGALGLYTVQSLDVRAGRIVEDLWRFMGGPTVMGAELLRRARASDDPNLKPTLEALLHRLDGTRARGRRLRRELVVCESVSLGVVVVSLVGFAAMEWLTAQPFTRLAVVLGALLGTGATGWVLLAMFRYARE